MILARSQERAFFWKPTETAAVRFSLTPAFELSRGVRAASHAPLHAERPESAADRSGMLFYQLTVSRKDHAPAHPVSGEANVMVRIDSDVETETTSAVRYLEKHGWEVTGVRHAQMADAVAEFAPDSRLVALYERAEREGIACMIPPSELV